MKKEHYSFGTNTTVSPNYEIFVLKNGMSDKIDKTSELKKFVEDNVEIDNTKIDKEKWWLYNNKDSNLNYYHSFFFKKFEDENFSIYSSIIGYSLKDCRKQLNIALIGCGNLSELRHINYCAKKYTTAGIKINVDVIDTTIWPINQYCYENTTDINSIRIIMTDYFYGLTKNNNYDLIIFSRATNLTEYNRYEKIDWDEMKYFNEFCKIVKPFVDSNKNVIIIDFDYECSNAKNTTKHFANRFFGYLKKAFKVIELSPYKNDIDKTKKSKYYSLKPNFRSRSQTNQNYCDTVF